MVKKLLSFTAALLLSVSMFAQKEAPIKFLGIPIDGTKAAMIEALKEKGFEHDKSSGEDILIGDFNGRKSHILIHTNRNKVDRIYVAYATPVDVAQIKIDYNNLLRQFQGNEKYIELEEQEPISASEDISYELTVHNKRYDATFWVKPSAEYMAQLGEGTEGMDEDEAYEYVFNKLFEALNGQVWFTINKAVSYDKYYISIYYDNLENKSNGEDL